MAFVFWSFRESAKKLTLKSPAIKTGGVLNAWNRARSGGVVTLTTEEALHDPGTIKTGMVSSIAPTRVMATPASSLPCTETC